MKIQEKIRFMRELKNWSQEDLAAKLGMSTNGYSKIERGETKANIPKLEQIADALDIDLMELLMFGEKAIACLIGDNNQNGNNISQVMGSTTEAAFEVQKLQLVVEHQQAMLIQKDKSIVHLEEMLALLKNP
ncbi:MAG: helix-turn-helix transcriptional regulator [Methylococcales bacterium]|nr:helix-turn-helix transcriptional regulator [Methylococcales bacterium]